MGDSRASFATPLPTLRSLALSPEYRRGHRDLVRDFYVPCLRASRSYQRAAGYFTSTSLALVAAGLPAFINAGGSMQLLASPYLEPEDIAALERGVEARSDVIQRALLRSFDELAEGQIVADRLGFLAWLIASGRLEIRIALPSDDAGLYHEKYGIFMDDAGDAVAFTGSPNETRGGLEANFESIDVFESWSDEGFRVTLKREAFDAAWRNQLPGLDTVPLPDAVHRQILRFRPKDQPTRDPLEPDRDPERSNDPPRGAMTPRPYQEEAVRAWVDAGHRGVLEMATGTGKTITAILAVDAWSRRHSPALVVVAAPYKHLVDQWAGVMRSIGWQPVLCYDDGAAWIEGLDRLASDLKIGLRASASCVMTHDALRSSRFAEWLGRLPGRVATVIVGDEVHNLGAPSSSVALQGLGFSARLGLSATPRRWSDFETEALFDYFGDPVYEFSLERAIKEGFLVPYEYHPHVVELAEDEFARYLDVSRRLARFPQRESSRPADAEMEKVRGALLRQRAGVLNNAAAKLDVLEQVLADRPLHFALAYTTPERMTDTVRVVSQNGRRLVHRFTYRESAAERRRLLSLFERGGMDALVAIRCLDEGVDIPRTEIGFILASSSNSREFIQRRGRLLRRAEGKAAAVIHDFLAIPPRGLDEDQTWAFERAIVRHELLRFDEFARLATNRYEAELGLVSVRRRYQLFDM